MIKINEMMKRFKYMLLCLWLLLLMPGGVHAVMAQTPASRQQLLEKVQGMIATKRVQASYTYTTGSEVTIAGAGTLLLDGNRYQLKGNGLEVYCDGTTRWTVDPSAKEVYVEAAAGLQDYLGHPETFLSCVSDLKEEGGCMTGTFTDSQNGTVLHFSFSSIVTSEPEPNAADFTFDTQGLDASWVITDLR